MRRNSLLLLMTLVFCLFKASAQEIPDTLSLKSLMAIVKQNHPVTKQARLLLELAKARKKQAWGGFDPKFETEFDRKIYDGTEYYSFLTPQIKLPLWYGLELKGSYSEAEGTYLNPESKLPKEGLSYAGLSFNLGKGLLMDKRRAAFKQAKIFEQSSENERIIVLNDLFLDAGETYINWQNKYANYRIYKEALRLSAIRFEAVKKGFIEGDKPAIDTVEALAQIQQREIAVQQAGLELLQAKYELSAFLWLDDGIPVDPNQMNAVPDEDFDLVMNIPPDLDNNPKILSYQYKLQDLNIERKLKAESLKPELNLTLGLLNQGKSALRNLNSSYWEQNNKVHVSFSFPLTFSQARGDLASSKIKIREAELELDLNKNLLDNKIKQNFAEQTTLQQQLLLIKQSLKANEQLLNGEETKFRLGDSSLFLVNSRESKLIDVKEKLYGIEAKIRKAKLKSLWLQGALPAGF